MPSPDKDPAIGIGAKIRSCFEPEEGERWCSLDYSQQEPRLTVHFAAKVNAIGAEIAVARYIEKPRTDYHAMVAEMTGRPRPVAKILNLAMTYGKGKRSLAEELGVSLQEAEAILVDYHRRLPFIKSLEDKCKVAAGARGYIRLIDGARMHYSQWEGGWIDWDLRKDAEARGKKLTPCSREEAEKRQADPEHPWSKTRLRRADTRKSLNNLIQGSAARQTKRAMLAMWREGIIPMIQMHDEVGISTAEERVALRAQTIMIETTPLVVPTIVDFEVGPTWGEAKKTWAEAVGV
jgi:DNA polymerase I-like protein with 3'-5' exonuclease and polymerase domains